MRTGNSRSAARALVAIAGACLTITACATATGGPATSAAPAPEAPNAEELRYLARAESLRADILRRASWAEMGAACNPGSLRVFEDTSAAGKRTQDEAAEALERVIIARGVDTPLDTPAGLDLLRTVILWEAAGPRPRWDTTDPKENRRAFATGLTGQYEDPDTKKCVSFVKEDSVVVIAPRVAGLVAPTAKNAMRITLITGDSAVFRARDAFYAAEGHTQSSVFTYTKLGPIVHWRDWALVVVDRPAEANGVASLSKGVGGAVYLFHRVANEWRLLLISRSWG